jgi:hypothetical protein
VEEIFSLCPIYTDIEYAVERGRILRNYYETYMNTAVCRGRRRREGYVSNSGERPLGMDREGWPLSNLWDQRECSALINQWKDELPMQNGHVQR